MPMIEFSELKPGYDALIVGGGTSGCFTALNLDSYINTLIVDYRKFPRFKACSGIIVRQAHDIIKKLNVPEDIYHYPKLIDIKYIDYDNNLESTSKKEFYNSDRKKLDEFLFKKTEEKGNISFLESTRLVDFSFVKKNFVTSILSYNNLHESVASKYFVGCDGAISTVREKISNVKINSYLAVQELIKMPNHGFKDAIFFFDSNITDHYAWIIPKSEFVEVGVALEPHNSREKYAEFKKIVEKRFGIKGKGELSSSMILRPVKINEIVLGHKNVLLAGEAAGFITPTGAEGISNALVSASNVANAINSKKDDVLKEYRNISKPLLERFNRKMHKLRYILDKNKRRKLFE